jgi:hypothetical protein
MTIKEKYVFLLHVVKDNGYLPSTSLSISSLCVVGKGFDYICFQRGGGGANSTEKCLVVFTNPMNETSCVKAQKK